MKIRIYVSLITFIILSVLFGFVVWMSEELFKTVGKIIAPSLFIAGLVYIFWFQVIKIFVRRDK